MQRKGPDMLRALGGIFDRRLCPLVKWEIFGAFLLSFCDVILEGVELTHQGRVMLVKDVCFSGWSVGLLRSLRATSAMSSFR
jgi:hypothetical protein